MRPPLRALTQERAVRAAEIAANHFLRGADALYVQLADETGATLITWDHEMLARAADVVPTMTPSDWLPAHAPPGPRR
jgi:predicted nucleic acid-binding protein